MIEVDATSPGVEIQYPEWPATGRVADGTDDETRVDEPADDASGSEIDYTVVGMWWESGERWMDYFTAATPEGAEDAAHLYAGSRSLHLAVTGVFEGRLVAVDQHVYVDPSARTKEEMDQIRRDTWYDDPSAGGDGIDDEPRRRRGLFRRR